MIDFAFEFWTENNFEEKVGENDWSIHFFLLRHSVSVALILILSNIPSRMLIQEWTSIRNTGVGLVFWQFTLHLQMLSALHQMRSNRTKDSHVLTNIRISALLRFAIILLFSFKFLTAKLCGSSRYFVMTCHITSKAPLASKPGTSSCTGCIICLGTTFGGCTEPQSDLKKIF